MTKGTPVKPTGIRETVDSLFREGAVLAPAEEPHYRMLVGALRWSSSRAIFVFAAYGEDARDARLMQFDGAAVAENGVVHFSRNGRLLATLSPIEKSGVDDPDDYRIAWQLWQQVMPLRTQAIDRCYAEMEYTGPEEA